MELLEEGSLCKVLLRTIELYLYDSKEEGQVQMENEVLVG